VGALDLLHHKPDLQGEDRHLMEIALREASRLEQLVTDFLGFARPAPARRVACDLAPLVAETLDVFAHDPDAGVRAERELATAPAFCDPDQVKQVIWNLLRNAAEAVADRPAGAPGGRVRAACGADAAGAWLSVEDDGPGIAPADRTRVFLPFFTTRQEGTGLGLSTVHRIVDAHGGSICVEAADGGGARFAVRLPDRPRGVAFPPAR
jgi:two-component system, NtrC family, sensor histidine kinase PilS